MKTKAKKHNKKSAKKAKRRYVYRSAITGKVVTRAYAEAHPDTTERETV